MQENLGEFHLFHSWVRSSLPSRWINGKMTEETARTRLSTFNIERCVVLVAIRTIPNVRHVLLSFKRQLERGFIPVATIVVMRIFLHIPSYFPFLFMCTYLDAVGLSCASASQGFQPRLLSPFHCLHVCVSASLVYSVIDSRIPC